MATTTSRRTVLKGAASAFGLWVIDSSWARGFQTPNERLNFACIGVGGQGGSDLGNAARFANIVALCDIDEGHLNQAGNQHPNAKKFRDFRTMLDQMHGQIDGVTVSTPDHCHAVATAMALHYGKACYTQKPLTRTIWECREIRRIARAAKVPTQMGNQGTAQPNVRKIAALVKAGVFGRCKQVHCWTDRPIWPQGIARPASQEIPREVAWDLWLGPAQPRPYTETYHPFGWRGWWDFGTGAMGDMACHAVSLPFMALDLTPPISVQADTSGTNHDSYPSSSFIRFEIPANGKRAPLDLYWYDGGRKPRPGFLPGITMPSNGSIMVFEHATLYTPDDYCTNTQIIGMSASDLPQVDYKTSPGHFDELALAIKGGPMPTSNFPDYSGPLTEMLLVGNLAVWAGGPRLQWDAATMKATGAEGLDHLIYPKFRRGYRL